jgi:surface antigen
MKQMNQRDAIHYIATQQEFKASALSGVNANTNGLQGAYGRLDPEEFARFKEVESQVSYVVYSYGTPIAWYTEGNGWYVVEQKFSVTTSKHQNYVRRAIAESLEIAV